MHSPFVSRHRNELGRGRQQTATRRLDFEREPQQNAVRFGGNHECEIGIGRPGSEKSIVFLRSVDDRLVNASRRSFGPKRAAVIAQNLYLARVDRREVLAHGTHHRSPFALQMWRARRQLVQHAPAGQEFVYEDSHGDSIARSPR